MDENVTDPTRDPLAAALRERAETLRNLIEGARYYRGRLSKLTLEDYIVILVTLDGDFPCDGAGAREEAEHVRPS